MIGGWPPSPWKDAWAVTRLSNSSTFVLAVGPVALRPVLTHGLLFSPAIESAGQTLNDVDEP